VALTLGLSVIKLTSIMSYADTLPKQRGFGETTRPDNWWLQPLAVFLGFSAFIVYSTWAALQGIADIHHHTCSYWFGPFNGNFNNGANYLSPFYSPEFWGTSPHAIGKLPEWWPAWLPFSPAFLILWVPGGFRFTCYYYRGAYYKAFWADPINCAVGEPRSAYLGERYFPLIIQNVHRYFFYLAALFIVLLSYDAWEAMWFTGTDGKAHFGLGLGTVVMILNPLFLALYTFGCHSFRHLVGGFLDIKSKSPLCGKTYDCVSGLNSKHMLWAWISLFWVGFTDVYIRFLAPHIDVVFFKL
jgi:hypothetical protein